MFVVVILLALFLFSFGKGMKEMEMWDISVSPRFATFGLVEERDGLLMMFGC
jgi:hypothetical protein